MNKEFRKAVSAALKAGVITKREAARLRSGNYLAGVNERITNRPTKKGARHG